MLKNRSLVIQELPLSPFRANTHNCKERDRDAGLEYCTVPASWRFVCWRLSSKCQYSRVHKQIGNTLLGRIREMTTSLGPARQTPAINVMPQVQSSGQYIRYLLLTKCNLGCFSSEFFSFSSVHRNSTNVPCSLATIPKVCYRSKQLPPNHDLCPTVL
jgi:hypothetical protein